MAAAGGGTPQISPFDLEGLTEFFQQVEISARETEAEKVRQHEKAMLQARQRHQLKLLSGCTVAIVFIALAVGSFMIARYATDPEVRKQAAGFILPGFTALLGFLAGWAAGGGKGD
jgi:hypothetical protein